MDRQVFLETEKAVHDSISDNRAGMCFEARHRRNRNRLMNVTERDANGVKNVYVVFDLKQLEQDRHRLFRKTSLWDAQLSQNVGPQRSFLWTIASAKLTCGLEYISRSAIVQR